MSELAKRPNYPFGGSGTIDECQRELQVAIDFARGSGDQTDWDAVTAMRRDLRERRRLAITTKARLRA